MGREHQSIERAGHDGPPAAPDPGGAHEDWALAARIRSGDAGAFDILMARYKHPILDFVYRTIGDAAEAEDVAQEVFVRAYRRLRRPTLLRARAAFSTWLFRVARNAALDRLRWRHRHPGSAPAALMATPFETPASDAAPDEAAQHRELGRAIAAAVAALPEDQRTAFTLFEYEGLPQAEIAAVLRCSAKAVETRLYRARRALRRRLAPRFGGPGGVDTSGVASFARGVAAATAFN